MRYTAIKDHSGKEMILSKLILGACPFGTGVTKEDSYEIMDTYFAHGGRCFDTARVYCEWLPNGEGSSERTLGAWIKDRGCRDQVIVITKGAHPPMTDMHAARVNPEAIHSDFAKSLEALQTDYIDIYLLHRDDENMPVSVIMDALDELVKAGKVRMLGASNWRAERIMEANAYARANGKTPFMVSEIQWSYAYCTPKETFEDDTLVCMNEQQMELYRQMDMPVLAYSSQAYGVFSCGYKEDLSDVSEKHKRFYCEENIRRYQEILKTCEEQGCTTSQVVLDYVTKNEVLNGLAIVGCSKKEQILASLDTMK